MARNRGPAVAAPAGGDSLTTQAMRIPTNGPHDGDTLSPEITPAPGTVDFGAVRVPVPAGGTVSVEPSTAGRIQAVHVTVPEGRLSVSALAAPRTGGLWPDLATEIDASLREGGARVRSFTGEWGRELHATTEGATSVFVGVDGPRWMLYGVATGPTRDAVGLDARLRRMLRGTVVVRGKAPFPVRTVLPLVTPSEGAGEVQTTAAPPTMTLRAPAAAAQDPAVPAPLAASVNGAVNGSANGAVNGTAVNGAAAGVSRRNGASTTGVSSTTGATRKDASPTAAGKPARGGSAARRQRAANGTGASVPFPPGATNGAARPGAGRSGGTTGATPFGRTGATPLGHSGASSPGRTGATPLGNSGANPLGLNGAGRSGGVTGANRLGPAAAAVPGGPGPHPTGNTGANPLGSAGASLGPAAAGPPGRVPGVPSLGTTGTTPFGNTGANPLGLNGVGRSGGVPGANRLGPAAAGRPGDVPGVPGRGPTGANAAAGTTGGHPLGLNGARRPAGTPGADRLGPAAADFAGGTPGEHLAGPLTAESRMGVDNGPLPADATWSGAHPLGAAADPGTSSYGVLSGDAPRHHPAPGTAAPDGHGSALPPWPPTHSAAPRPTGSYPVAGPTTSGTTGAHPAPDVAPWAAAYGDPPGPAGLQAFASGLGSGRPEVPAGWAHESGVVRPPAASFSVDDLVGDRAEPSAPWETSLPPATPSYPQAPEPARTPLSEPRAADRQPPSVGPGRSGRGQWDPLVDPLPIALDPLPAPSPTWTDGSSTAAPHRSDRDGDAAGSANGAGTPRWRAADLLRDRDRDAAANGSSGRWRAADLLAGRDDTPEPTSLGGKWLAADLLARRSPATERDSAPVSGRSDGDHGANDDRARSRRRGTYDDRAGGGGRGAGDGAAATSWGSDDGIPASGPGFGSDTDPGGYGAEAPRWRAADLLDGAEPRTNGRARRRGAESAPDPHVNGHVAASHAGDGAVPRWRAADLLPEGRFDGTAAEDRASAEPPAEPRRSRAHDRDNATASTWQAAELLDGPAPHAEPDGSSRWRAASLLETGHDSAGGSWRAADLLDRRVGGAGASARRRTSDDSGSGQRHAQPPVDVRPDPVPTHTAGDTPHRHGDDRYASSPTRVPPTQWAWPKEPEAAPDPLPTLRADGGRRSAWAAADLLDEGAHAGGRRRARETKHGKPDDEDAGRHYRP